MQGIKDERHEVVTKTRWSKSTKKTLSNMPLYKDDVTATAHLVTVAELGHAYVQRHARQTSHTNPWNGSGTAQLTMEDP